MNIKIIIVTLLFILCVFYLISICYVHVNDETPQVNLITCSTLNNFSFSDQINQIAYILEIADRNGKNALFLKWKFDHIFEDRISKMFVYDFPAKFTSITTNNIESKIIENIDIQQCMKNFIPTKNSTILYIRHLFTFKFIDFVFEIMKKLPHFTKSCCIGLYLNSKETYNIPFIINSIGYLLSKNFSSCPLVIFCNDWVWYHLQKNLIIAISNIGTNIILSKLLQTQEEIFVAFSMCNFKILTYPKSSFLLWSSWLDNRYNSMVLFEDNNYQIYNKNWISVNAIDNDNNNNNQHETYPKFGGMIRYNHRTFGKLCEAFRRIYPHSCLKVLIGTDQLHLVDDIQFYHGDIINLYSNIEEFIEIGKQYTEPFFILIQNQEQFIYPISPSDSIFIFNTSYLHIELISTSQKSQILSFLDVRTG